MVNLQINERLVEVPEPQIVDRIIEIPQIQEIVKELPGKPGETRLTTREVPTIKVETVERTEEIEEIEEIPRYVEVPIVHEVVRRIPRLEIIEIPIERVIQVPKKIIQEIEQPVYRPVPHLVRQAVNRQIAVPRTTVQSMEVVNQYPEGGDCNLAGACASGGYGGISYGLGGCGGDGYGCQGFVSSETAGGHQTSSVNDDALKAAFEAGVEAERQRVTMDGPRPVVPSTVQFVAMAPQSSFQAPPPHAMRSIQVVSTPPQIMSSIQAPAVPQTSMTQLPTTYAAPAPVVQASCTAIPATASCAALPSTGLISYPAPLAPTSGVLTPPMVGSSIQMVANPFSSQYASPQQLVVPPVTSGTSPSTYSTYGNTVLNPFASAGYTGTGPPTPPVPVRSAGQAVATGLFDVFD